MLIADREWAAFFEEAVGVGGDPKVVCNWMTGDLAKMLNDSGVSLGQSRIGPAHIVDLARLLESGAINGKMAKELFAESFRTGDLPGRIAAAKGASQITDETEIRAIVQKVLAENLSIVEKYKSGNVGVKGYLVGQIMKQTSGRANPAIVQSILASELD